MAKILVAIIAALCAFAALQAVQGVPAPSFEPLGASAQQLEILEKELDKNPQLKFWLNATAILEQIEKILADVEDKIKQVSNQVQTVVSAIMDGIQNTALEFAEQWNSALQAWVDKANQAGVDIKECLNSQQSLSDVVDGLRSDIRQCVADPISDLNETMKDMNNLGPQAKALVEETKADIDECSAKGNIFAVGVCLTGYFPTIQIKAAALVARGVYLTGLAGVKTAAIGPVATLCTTKCTVGRSAQASAIVDSTIKCIKDKLLQ